MTFDRTDAIVIIVGSVLFMAAAFSPISRVFAIPDPVEKLAIIQDAATQWTVAQALFALGALVTAAGIGMLAYRAAGDGPSFLLAAATAVMALGAVLWSWHVYGRAVDPAAFASGELAAWPFALYSLLTMAGLVLIGMALLQTQMAPWVGWLSIGAAALFLVLGVIFRDMPPFVYYVVTLTAGIMLFRAAAAPTVG